MQFKLWHTGVLAKTPSDAQQLVDALARPRPEFGGSEKLLTRLQAQTVVEMLSGNTLGEPGFFQAMVHSRQHVAPHHRHSFTACEV